MNTAIKQLTDEAHEILVNIRNAAIHGEITWTQRDELVSLVMSDVHMKIELAGNLLHEMNTCLVEFTDGFKVATSRNYVRKHHIRLGVKS
jgi:hypothetical protein